MRVGLLGGSFDPAHAAHAHVAETALARLGLDLVVWLVSPQNPLKAGAPASLAERMAGARKVARGPRMRVSDVESRIGARYTLDALRALQARFPGVHFVWLMGADNLVGFHRWRGWREIFRRVPIAVVARPGPALKGRSGVAAQRFRHARRPQSAASILALLEPPAWLYLTAPLSSLSSTALRAARDRGAAGDRG